MSKRKGRPQRGPSRWWPYAVLAGAGLAAIAFFAVSQNQGSPTAQGNRATAGSGLAVGGSVPSIPLGATNGQTVSLDQFRGSKLVVFFYEGAT